jgi:hypothetical protein
MASASGHGVHCRHGRSGTGTATRGEEPASNTRTTASHDASAAGIRTAAPPALWRHPSTINTPTVPGFGLALILILALYIRAYPPFSSPLAIAIAIDRPSMLPLQCFVLPSIALAPCLSIFFFFAYLFMSFHRCRYCATANTEGSCNSVCGCVRGRRHYASLRRRTVVPTTTSVEPPFLSLHAGHSL